MKLNKNIIYYITEDLPEKKGFILNCKTNTVLELDELAVTYFLRILNAENKKDIEDILVYFEGCDLFE